MKFFLLGRVLGVGLMIVAFCWLVYLLMMGQDMLRVWEVAAMFWFGSSLYWQSCCYEDE